MRLRGVRPSGRRLVQRLCRRVQCRGTGEASRSVHVVSPLPCPPDGGRWPGQAYPRVSAVTDDGLDAGADDSTCASAPAAGRFGRGVAPDLLDQGARAGVAPALDRPLYVREPLALALVRRQGGEVPGSGRGAGRALRIKPVVCALVLVEGVGERSCGLLCVCLREAGVPYELAEDGVPAALRAGRGGDRAVEPSGGDRVERDGEIAGVFFLVAGLTRTLRAVRAARDLRGVVRRRCLGPAACAQRSAADLVSDRHPEPVGLGCGVVGGFGDALGERADARDDVIGIRAERARGLCDVRRVDLSGLLRAGEPDRHLGREVGVGLGAEHVVGGGEARSRGAGLEDGEVFCVAVGVCRPSS